MPVGNGNNVKGNIVKKRARKKKATQAELDPDCDQYAKVISPEGGKHLRVMPLGSYDKKTVAVDIPGRFHKKVWFNKDDIIVITHASKDTSGRQKFEVKGRVGDGEVARIRTKFDRMDGDGTNALIFGDVDNLSDDEDDNKKIPMQPIRKFKLEDIDEKEEINIDEI